MPLTDCASTPTQLPGYALLRQRHAHAAYSRRLSRIYGLRGTPGGSGACGVWRREFNRRAQGQFDVFLEASGSAAAITLGLRILRPRGLFICVGQGAQTTLPVSQIATQKIELRGAFELAADNSRSMKLQLSF